ncbi:hypothetical protein [Streptococcus marmotae]|uniref:hypothetical protein n=1 Tax=Streptococcus marmotae TaxID=1825069 RepID=UPI00082EFC45|nr:hypothetical protein [Streptococcus marmotae]QBX16921.1 hypothetical protein Javan291_0045 [Streptococcus phage Javan291]
MALYESKCNLTLLAEGESLLVGDKIELSQARADEINQVVRGIFQDIPQALVAVEVENASAEKPKRSRKKVVEDTEAES